VFKKNKILFIISFFWVSILSAQEISKDLYLKRSIRQDNQNFQFKIFEGELPHGFIYKQTKYYYWFKSQTVVCTQGASSGLLLHGLFEAFYDNKQLSSRGVFDKGLKHGNWTYWNQKGIIIKTETWDYGVKRGDEKHFDDHGNLLTTIDYGFKNIQRITKDSIICTTKEGIYKKVILLDSVGNEVKTIKYKNGRVVESRKLKVKSPLRGPQGKLREPQGKAKESKNEKEGFWKRIFSKEKKDSSSESKKKQASTKISWKFWKKKTPVQSR
jgi:antitoxin component YwqK of YwqJK toxin-antitoxin module